MSADGVEVTSAEIARIAGVKPTAVSNWRRRHDDFPRPVGGTDRSPRFALTEVEHWLASRDHSPSIDPDQRLWQALDSARSAVPMDRLLGQVGLFLLHLHLHPGSPAPGGHADLAARLQEAEQELLEILRGGGVADMIARRSGFDSPRYPDTLFDLATHAANENGASDSFDKLVSRFRQTSQAGSHTVSPALADLMVSLTGTRDGTIVDPACGRGELLLAAGRSDQRRLLGQERDHDAAWVAALRLAFAAPDTTALDIHADNALRKPVFGLDDADSVVCAPPFGDRNWGVEEVGDDRRWVYGVPPRLESDLAWVQHCLAQARSGGRVVILLPPGAAQRPSGRRIRRALLTSGAVRAIIALPPGMAAHYTTPLQIWILADQHNAPEPVLLMDSAPPTHIGQDAETTEREVLPWIGRTWEAFLSDPHGFIEQPGQARALDAIELLDDDIDLTPRLHLPLPRQQTGDLATFTEHRERLHVAVQGLTLLLPDLQELSETTEQADDAVTLGELAKAGSVTMRRTRPHGEDEDGPTRQVRVINGEDVIRGGGTWQTGEVDPDPMRNPPIQEGDVLIPVVAPRPTARVATAADSGAYPGAGIHVVRTNPAAVDPWFLAGFVTSTEEVRNIARLSSSARGHLRVDPNRLKLPVLPIETQRRYGELFRQVWRFKAALRDVDGMSQELSGKAVDLIADAVRGQTEYTRA